MAERMLVTGGAGFIGSNFIRAVLEARPNTEVVNLDALTYAGVASTVAELEAAFTQHHFVKGDIRNGSVVDEVVAGAEVVVHFAAETHVDRSIESPVEFLDTNIIGTNVLLDSARRHGVRRFVHVSTDEVYGSVATGFAAEDAPLRPSSPYSASKAGSDLLALSYHTTFGTDVIVTRCTNNYGPYQFPEKVIPLFVTNLLDGMNVPLYGDGMHERDWLHVSDHCSALMTIIEKGSPGEVYNIGANNQLANVDLTEAILDALGLDQTRVDHVTDRPGHDRRYAVDSSKVRALGWEPATDLAHRLRETIDWYRARHDWWRPLKTAAAR